MNFTKSELNQMTEEPINKSQRPTEDDYYNFIEKMFKKENYSLFELDDLADLIDENYGNVETADIDQHFGDLVDKFAYENITGLSNKDYKTLVHLFDVREEDDSEYGETVYPKDKFGLVGAYNSRAYLRAAKKFVKKQYGALG